MKALYRALESLSRSEPIPGVKCKGCESDRFICTFVGSQGACVMCRARGLKCSADMTKMSAEEKKRAQLTQKFAKITGDILSVHDIVGSDSRAGTIIAAALLPAVDDVMAFLDVGLEGPGKEVEKLEKAGAARAKVLRRLQHSQGAASLVGKVGRARAGAAGPSSKRRRVDVDDDEGEEDELVDD